MHRVIVIGFGNTLRQDDGFGPLVVERLSDRLLDPRVEFFVRSTLTPELAEALSETEHVIFVDASADLAPGVLERRALASDAAADVSLVHFLSPEALLVWTSRVYGRVPTAELWLVGVDQTGLSEELTPCLASRVPEVLNELEQAIRERFGV